MRDPLYEDMVSAYAKFSKYYEREALKVGLTGRHGRDEGEVKGRRSISIPAIKLASSENPPYPIWHNL
jgi:hypothetical protein